MTLKQVARDLQDDYIPRGEVVLLKECTGWRRTRGHEVFRCTSQVGYDLQSGPIYCGAVAEYVARSPGGHPVSGCDQHTPETYRKAAEAKGGAT